MNQLIFINGNIHTANKKQPWAQAIAINGARISAVGSSSEIHSISRKRGRTIDLQSATVVPGLTDSHCHVIGVGERELKLNLDGAASLEELLRLLKSEVDKSQRDAWITGRGWNETFWNPPVLPNRTDLDRVAPRNPVLLTRADYHAAVANSAALSIAGINNLTPDPFGGAILRDAVTGMITGMLLDAAQQLVRCNIPPPTSEELENAILAGAQRSIELGWCEIHNPGSRRPEIQALRKLYDEKRIKLRVYNSVYGPGPETELLLRDGPLINAFDHRFSMRAIKVLLDGALGSRGAALLEPYSDSGTTGFLTEEEGDLLPIFEEALRRGLQVQTHAIGDRANRVALDLYEQALRGVPLEERPTREPRWRIEHAQLLHPSDIPRFARLGVIPSMQPSHAISDLLFASKRLGRDRSIAAYAWRDFIESGVIIAGGTDAPVERGDPIIEFYAAVARKTTSGYSDESWHPEQAVSREDALKMFTMWPAIAAFEESDRGSIEVGKLADLTVLSADIMKTPESEILKTRCLMTVIGGEIVFDALS